MMSEFEDYLRQQSQRRIPAEWRREILNAARQQPAAEATIQPPWWRAWLWPAPAAWAGVAGAWVLIIGLNLASRPSASELAGWSPGSPQEIRLALLHKRQLELGLFRSENEPAEPPRQRPSPGACNGRVAQNPIV
jgi:hypothetical protein